VHVREVEGERVLYVATDDPTEASALSACSRDAKMPVRPMIAETGDIRLALARLYGAPPPSGLPPPLEPAPESPAVDDVAAPSRRARAGAPGVLVLNASERFHGQCSEAIASLGARLIHGSLVVAADLVTEHRPCAIVVSEDVYAFDRAGLNRLAIDHDALLVVWSDDAEGKHLAPLLAGAVLRWQHASYEKGAVLDRRYELWRELGSTAAGSRWEVRHVRTARRGVLCVAAGGDAGRREDESLTRVQRALARLVHPGAVDLRDAGTSELGDPYLVLEPLDGRTLEGVLAARGSVSVDDAIAIALQLADALGCAHACGVAHGDVSPANVVLVRGDRERERVKLTGWENARFTDNRRRHANDDDVRADVQALGALLFAAIVGHPPSPGEGVPSHAAKGSLSSIIERAIAEEPSARFDSMRDLSAALLEAAPGARDHTALLAASPQKRSLPPAEEDAAEMRRAPRAPYRTPVRIELPGLGAVDGRSEDISVGGLLVITRSKATVGSLVTVRFALPIDGKVVGERAVVKWSRSAKRGGDLCAIGIELGAPSAETRSQIERYVAFMTNGEDDLKG
jgi:hypothetical protein